MINVEDGDAIFIGLKKESGEKALIAIDGGFKKYFKDRVEKRLKELLEEYGRIALLVCTHYDNDHLSGTENIIEYYHDKIDKIWLHKANGELTEKISELNEHIAKLEAEHALLLEKKDSNPTAFKASYIIEDYKKLVKVLQMILDKKLEHKVHEPVAGDTLEGFEELEVISPSYTYYNDNLDALASEQLILEHASNFEGKYFFPPQYGITDPKRITEMMKLTSPCEHLEKSSLKNSVTATNMISIVLLLTDSDSKRKYLFTGDAGIETFEDNVEDWKTKLSGLYWLDLPHHGSKNNTSRNMLDVFDPSIVFVSASGKANRPSKFIKHCLDLSSKKVWITNDHDEPETWYLKLDQNGKESRVHVK